MKKKRRVHVSIFFIVLIAAIAGLAYYLYGTKSTPPPGITPPESIKDKSGYLTPPDQDSEEPGYSKTRGHDGGAAPGRASNGQPSSKTSNGSEASLPANDQQEPGAITGPIEQPASSKTPGGAPGVAESGHVYPFSGPFAGSSAPRPGDEDFCKAVQSEMNELFSYLEQKDYIALEPGTTLRDRFNDVTAALSASPPAPAGESLDPAVLFKNIYHIYRILNINDIKIIKDILHQEREDIEVFMQVFYRWLSSSDECPKNAFTRPSKQNMYLYAGFFINTIGGRTILFRRDPLFRILFTYYCVLVIHEADREKRNPYGIDLVPFIDPLRRQISYYPEIIFRDHYLSLLDKIDNYYQKNRQ
jgi:hypothetical protein